MSNVIKENLRIQPPVAYLPTRVVKEDIEFEGKMIPKGVSLTTTITYLVLKSHAIILESNWIEYIRYSSQP